MLSLAERMQLRLAGASTASSSSTPTPAPSTSATSSSAPATSPHAASAPEEPSANSTSPIVNNSLTDVLVHDKPSLAAPTSDVTPASSSSGLSPSSSSSSPSASSPSPPWAPLTRQAPPPAQPLPAARSTAPAPPTSASAAASFVSALQSQSRWASSVESTVTQTLATREFGAFMDSQLLRRLVPDCLGSFLPYSLPQQQLNELARAMEQQVSEEVRAIFPRSASLTVNVHQDVKLAREFALRAALQRHYQRAAAAASSSSSASTPSAPSTPLPASSTSTASSRPRPVFYMTKGSPLMEYAHAFAFMNDCVVKVIPLCALRSETPAVRAWSMDLSHLEAEINKDLASGDVPCAVLASLGSKKAFQVDPVRELRKLCSRFQLWLHFEGPSLIYAAASGHPLAPAFCDALFECANSIACDPFDWFVDTCPELHPLPLPVVLATSSEQNAPHPEESDGEHDEQVMRTLDLLSDPHFTLFHSTPSSNGGLTLIQVHEASFTPPVQTVNSSYFSALFRVWNLLISHPRSLIRDGLEQGLALAQKLTSTLSQFSMLRVIGPAPHLHPELIFFQVQPSSGYLAELVAHNLDINSYNRWIISRVKPLMRECYMTELLYQGQRGFLFRPIEVRHHLTHLQAPQQHLAAVAQIFEPLCRAIAKEMDYVHASLRLREPFHEFVHGNPNLVLVPASEVQGFVGVGAFRLVPPVLAANSQLFGKELNQINAKLAQLLQEHHDTGLYDTALCRDGTECVVVKASPVMLDDDAAGAIFRAIEEASARLEMPDLVVNKMAEVVSQGIREAEARIQRRRGDSARPTTLLRKVPIVGSVWSWISPPGQEATDSSAFDIRSGTIQTPHVDAAAPARPAHEPEAAPPKVLFEDDDEEEDEEEADNDDNSANDST